MSAFAILFIVLFIIVILCTSLAIFFVVNFAKSAFQPSTSTTTITNITGELAPIPCNSTTQLSKSEIGTYVFDGWSSPVCYSNCNDSDWNNLLNGSFNGREPLTGWELNQSGWDEQVWQAHEAGISFFAFDWYYHYPGFTGNNYTNDALGWYLNMSNNYGVKFAIFYVNNEPKLVVPQSEWQTQINQWITQDFENPNYLKIDGEPVFMYQSESAMITEFGNKSNVNAALDQLRSTAEADGFNGVYIIVTADSPVPNGTGGYTPNITNQYGGLAVNAISAYGEAGVTGFFNGSKPMSAAVTATNNYWDFVANTSPFPYIPVIAPGWNSTPISKKGTCCGSPDIWWFSSTPQDFYNFTIDAINWVNANPNMQVQPGRPIVIVSAWDELAEGHYLVPTVGTGYSYTNALANAVCSAG